MSSYVDWKYLDQLFLLGYKKRSPYLANFSCPRCDEATTSHHPNKKRAYLIEKEGKVFFFCHRCGVSMSASRFIDQMDPALYKEYRFECLKESGGLREKQEPNFAVSFLPRSSLLKKIELPTILDLEDNHYAKQYVQTRQIPRGSWGKIHFVLDFRRWINTLIPNKFDVTGTEDPRIVFPFYNEKGILHAVQGRLLSKTEKVKYILIVLDDTIPSVYGLDTIDWSKTVYVVEGPIDSFFLSNCIASIGSDVATRVQDLPRENMVFVLDNEPRSFHMRQKMSKAIDMGYKIVIWPQNIREKDINEMILGGKTVEKIKKIIDSNIHEGLLAHVMLSGWSKTNGQYN